MEGELLRKDEIQDRAAHGHPMTQTEASDIASTESDMTGMGPIKGAAAATAQSAHDRQRNYIEIAGDVARKPADQITKDEASEVQKAEARAMGGPPGKGSMSANVQSVCDQNKKS